MRDSVYSVEVIREYSDAILRDILAVHRDTLPESWRYQGEEDYYKEQLKNQNTIHLLLRKHGRTIGYLLAIPHNEAVTDEELRKADPDLVEDVDRLYVETMEIVPKYAKSLIAGKLFLLMLRVLHEEAWRRGINKYSMHARVNSGLNQILRKIYGKQLTLFRKIDNWPFYDFKESAEYIEGSLELTTK